ncbi:EAL domain-containing protein, partial [Undibacterium sp. CCC2.1]|uniref:EAL domain-containing protein n=2 Tax=Pseudomonadota TaxID=1224 RepID=UPI002B22E2CB
LELDTLKIDRQFVARLFDSPRGTAVARSVIQLCRELGILIIAEGVEKAEQYHWLAENGCHLVQGAWVAPPLTVEDARQFVKPFDWNECKGI